MKRIYLSLSLSVVTAVLGLGFLLNGLYNNLQVDEVDLYQLPELASYQQILEHLIKELEQKGSSAQAQFDLVNQSERFLGLSIEILDIDELALPASLSQQLHSLKPLILAEQTHPSPGQPLTLSLYRYSSSLDKLLSISGVSVTLPASDWRIEKIVFTLMFYVGLCGVLALWLAPLVSRLAKLYHASRDFGEGNLSARVAVGKLSYIKELEQTFNTMAGRIETLVSDNKLLSRAVSHDLKTPLARLRFGVDMLLDREEFSQSSQLMSYRKRLDDDLNEMQHLIDSLLDFAKLDQHQLPLQLEEVRLSDLISALIERHQAAPVTIETKGLSHSLVLQADKHYLNRLFSNLLGNAVRFADTRILISGVCTGSELVVSIENDGRPLSESECGSIFKPFVRGQADSIRPDRDHHHGLGLAICERIACWHHAKIRAGNSAELGGAKFTVTFAKIKGA